VSREGCEPCCESHSKDHRLPPSDALVSISKVMRQRSCEAPGGNFSLYARWPPTEIYYTHESALDAMSDLTLLSRTLVRRLTPLALRRWVRRKVLFFQYPFLVHQHRLTPVSRNYGYGRGHEVDRHYVEIFLSGYADDIGGRVLEIRDARYTTKFGGNRVARSDILDVDPANQNATIIADLSHEHEALHGLFDCIICTQTLMLIYDLPSTVRTVFQMLKPGGVLLVTVAGISQIFRHEMDHGGDYWRFTSLGLKRLFEGVFGQGTVSVRAYGNVLTAAAFLYGLAVEDLRKEELDYRDPDYEVMIGLRAVKCGSSH
jgi:SAM-dependent methyltransferase